MKAWCLLQGNGKLPGKDRAAHLILHGHETIRIRKKSADAQNGVSNQGKRLRGTCGILHPAPLLPIKTPSRYLRGYEHGLSEPPTPVRVSTTADLP